MTKLDAAVAYAQDARTHYNRMVDGWESSGMCVVHALKSARYLLEGTCDSLNIQYSTKWSLKRLYKTLLPYFGTHKWFTGLENPLSKFSKYEHMRVTELPAIPFSDVEDLEKAIQLVLKEMKG